MWTGRRVECRGGRRDPCRRPRVCHWAAAAVRNYLHVRLDGLHLNSLKFVSFGRRSVEDYLCHFVVKRN
jgi:hypothetical protein